MNWPVSKPETVFIFRLRFWWVSLPSLRVCLGAERHVNGDTSPFAWSRFNCEMTADLLDSFSHALKAKTTAACYQTLVKSNSIVSQVNAASGLVLSQGQIQFGCARVAYGIDDSLAQRKV
jgi:hypothetical protein